MLRWLLSVAAATWLVAAVGCGSAGIYVRNRAGDLLDVVTLELTAGPGVDVHFQATGFFGTAVGYSTQKGPMLHGRFYGIGARETAGVLVFGSTAVPAGGLTSLVGPGVFQGRQRAWVLLLPMTLGVAEGLHVGFLPAWPHVADVEFGGSLGAGFHVGVSPGELLDFVVGFTTLDIAGDDAGGEGTPARAERDVPPITLWPGLGRRSLWMPW